MVIDFSINDKNLTIFRGFMKVYGFNKRKSLTLCNKLGYALNNKFSNLTFEDKYKLNLLINKKFNYIYEADLKKKNNNNIKILKKLRNYRGMRHILYLPVNGQRTKTNAKTQKWKKK